MGQLGGDTSDVWTSDVYNGMPNAAGNGINNEQSVEIRTKIRYRRKLYSVISVAGKLSVEIAKIKKCVVSSTFSFIVSSANSATVTEAARNCGMQLNTVGLRPRGLQAKGICREIVRALTCNLQMHQGLTAETVVARNHNRCESILKSVCTNNCRDYRCCVNIAWNSDACCYQ